MCVQSSHAISWMDLRCPVQGPDSALLSPNLGIQAAQGLRQVVLRFGSGVCVLPDSALHGSLGAEDTTVRQCGISQ